MVSHKKAVIYGVIILLISLSTTAYCEEKYNQKIALSKLSGTKVISSIEIKNITLSGDIRIADDSPASGEWTPKIRKNTLNEIITWLQQAKQYKEKIPKSQIPPERFKANIEPSTLFITTSDKHVITIQPAFYLSLKKGVNSGVQVKYVTNILILKKDNQESYIQCTNLYDWLKNDKWKTEFKHSTGFEDMDKELSNQKYSYSTDIDKKYVAIATFKSEKTLINQYLINKDGTLDLNLPIGTLFAISLPANRTVAYTWNIKNNLDNGVIQYENRSWIYSTLPKTEINTDGMSYDRQNFYFISGLIGNEKVVMRYEYQAEQNNDYFEITFCINVQ